MDGSNNAGAVDGVAIEIYPSPGRLRRWKAAVELRKVSTAGGTDQCATVANIVHVLGLAIRELTVAQLQRQNGLRSGIESKRWAWNDKVEPVVPKCY